MNVNNITTAAVNAVTSAVEAATGTEGGGFTNAVITAVGNASDTVASVTTRAAELINNTMGAAAAAGGTEPGHAATTTTTTTTLGASSTTTEGGATGGAGAADNGLSSGAIAGIAVGVLVAVGVVCTAIGCYCRRTCHRGSESRVDNVEMGAHEGHHAPDTDGANNDAFESDEDGNRGSNERQSQVRFEPPQGGGNGSADSDS